MAAPRGSSRVKRVVKAPARWPWIIVVAIMVVVLVTSIGWHRGSASVTHRAIAEVVTAVESGDHLALQELTQRTLPVDPSGNELRQRLARAIKPLLVRGSDRDVVVTALTVASRQACDGLAVPVVELVRSWPETIRAAGEMEVTAALIMKMAPADPARVEEAGRVLHGLAAMIDAGNDGRELALYVLTHLSDPALGQVPEFNICLARLQRMLPDPASVNALRAVTTSVFRNADLANQLGNDAGHWISYMKSELERHRHLVEIQAWLAANGMADRVADGVEKLEAHQRFLDEAAGLCDGWLADTSWSTSFATRRSEVESIAQRVKQAQAVTRTALAGARFGSGKKH